MNLRLHRLKSAHLDVESRTGTPDESGETRAATLRAADDERRLPFAREESEVGSVGAEVGEGSTIGADEGGASVGDVGKGVSDVGEGLGIASEAVVGD